jgi:S-methylmethionine-dependent homocysteine/selenocysteine methylase
VRGGRRGGEANAVDLHAKFVRTQIIPQTCYREKPVFGRFRPYTDIREPTMQAKYRHALPQTGDDIFLSDGGIETTLIFLDGLELPSFAAFDLLRTREGRAALERYYAPYVALAKRERRGLVLESATWRSNPEWGAALGYSPEALDAVNADAIELMRAIREAEETPTSPMVLSGCIGPRGDGYAPDRHMSAAEAEAYHGRQVRVFEAAGVDLVTAITMTYLEEGVGVARAAKAARVPAVISFTVETDGRLRTGMGLGEAIEACDAATGGYPAYYMVNCAHPTHFRDRLTGGDWIGRIGGIRANASKMSHAELDEAPELDPGDPEELGRDYRALMAVLPRLRVLGGCCGTDHRHIGEISRACEHRRHAA